MTSVFRVGIVRLVGRQTGLLNTQLAVPAVLQKCNISGKSLRGTSLSPKPKPWPYATKKYGLLQAMYDKTTKRMDENSKIILVEGPIGVGKSKFAKELAAELEMLYVPEANMDMIYINSYGFDLRKLDAELPASCRSYDTSNFCLDPHNPLAAQYQIRMYYLRFSQYVDALAHVLSSGQGVVMDRSVYSDFVFLEAMFRNGYISAGARSVYNEIKSNTITELMKPHLIIYLDCPVNVVKDRIKARNINYEIKSKVFTDKYLKDMEEIYKQQFLRDISIHGELLIYDWSGEGETEVIVEDIERIDFDKFEVDRHNKKMKDWRLPLEWDWCERRILYCNQKDELLNYFNVPRFDVPELVREAEDGKILRDVWYNAPGMKYAKGYNEDMGDTGLIFKTNNNYREPL